MYDTRINNDGSVSVIDERGGVVAGPYTDSPKTSAIEKAKRRIRDLNKAREPADISLDMVDGIAETLAAKKMPATAPASYTLQSFERVEIHSLDNASERALNKAAIDICSNNTTTAFIVRPDQPRGVFPHVAKKHYRRHWR